MDAPVPQGHRLGLVVGSALSASTAAPDDAERRVLDVGDGRRVEVLEAGSLVVLARHGLDGFTPAHLIDHHANIAALAAAGCDRIVAAASVGSLRTDWPVGTVVVPDDVLALGVAPSYFNDERGHRVPGFDEAWRAAVLDAWGATCATPAVAGGTYAMTTGPRFETPAEIRLLAAHADVVGMTVPAELFLAGEAGLAYVAVCQIDNLANGLAGEELDLADFRANVEANRARLQSDLDAVMSELSRRTST